MPVLRPDGDVGPDGVWTNNAGGTSRWDHLQAPGQTVHARRSVRGPVRILIFANDDGARWPGDFVATFTKGPRAGQLVQFNTKTRIIDLGTLFANARTDHCPCQPGRAAFMGGNRSQNHGNSVVSTADYYQLIVQGLRVGHVWAAYNLTNPSMKTWAGPIEADLSLKAAKVLLAANPADTIGLQLAAQTKVAAASQPFVGQSSNKRLGAGRGDGSVGVAGEDDIQASTGSWPAWVMQALSRIGQFDHLAIIEKLQNGNGLVGPTAPYNASDPVVGYWDGTTSYSIGDQRAYHGHFYTSLTNANVGLTPDTHPGSWTDNGPALTDRRIPAACTYAALSGDDNQDHYHYTVLEYDSLIHGPNPPDGDGQIGVRTNCDYDYPLASLTYNAGTNLVTAVTTTSVPSVTAGETLEIGIDLTTGGTGWNVGNVSAHAVSDTTFTFTPAAAPTGTPVLTAGMLYPRKWFQSLRYAKYHTDWLARVGAHENVICYHGPHLPHASVDGDSFQSEKAYENTVDGLTVPQSQAYGWGGVQGAHMPGVSDVDAANTAHTKTYSQRMEMTGSMDDQKGVIIDAWDAKFGAEGYWILDFSDNGFDYGAHNDTEGSDAFSPIGGKVSAFEQSLRISFNVRGPKFAKGVIDHTIVELADVPMTILDLVGQIAPECKTHHAHTDHDGTSIRRKQANPGSTQHYLGRGKYLSAVYAGTQPASVNNPKVIDRFGNALIRRFDDATVRELFLGDGLGSPDDAEYETINHENDNTTTQALANDLAGILTQLMLGRWDAPTSTHTGKI